ncbi:MAG: flippase [Bacteroidota bacterium]
MNTKATGWIKAGSYSLLGYAAQMGFGFVSFLVLVRLLPEYEFGVWVLYMTALAFPEMGRSGLLQNAVVKFCVEEEESYGDILMTGLWLNTLGGLGLGLILGLICWPLSWYIWEAPELAYLIWLYIPWALIHGTARFLDFPSMVHHDFKGIFWSKIAYGLLFLVGILVVWQWRGEVRIFWLPILQTLAAIPSLLVLLFYRRDYLRWGNYSPDWAKRIFHFGKFVLGTNVSSMLFNKMDLMMVGAFINPAAVAVYSVATKVTNYLEVPMSGISQAIYPKLAMANSNGSKSEVGKLYEKSVGIIVAMILPLAILVLGLSEWVVTLIAGEAYVEAAPLLNILVLAVMIKPWGRLFGITLDAIGRPQLNFQLLVFSLLMNIILNAVFISLWGLPGAAMATAVSIVLLVVTGQILIERIIPINQWNILRQVLAVYTRPRQLLNL